MCLISLVIQLGVFSIAIYRRRAKCSLYYLYLNLAILVYIFGSIFEAAEPNSYAYLQVARVQYIGAVFISPMILLFIIDLSDIRIRLRKHALPLLIFPAAIAASMYVRPDIMTPVIENRDSIFRYVYFCYTYIVMVLAIVVAVLNYSNKDNVFKKQIKLIMFAIMIPMLGNFFVFSNIVKMDITVLCLAASGVFIGYALLFGKLFYIAPIAREEIVENMRDGFILVGLDGNFLDANVAAKNLFPMLKTTSVGQPISKVGGLHWGEGGMAEQIFSLETETGVKHYRTSLDVVTHDGAAICQCITVNDITPVQELLNETIRLAEYDSLTGLMNRGTFYRRVEEKCLDMARGGGDALVLLMDLDSFKQINDTYGHLAGDEVLRAVSAKLLSRFRKTDFLARYGGEEFCAFLPVTNVPDAIKIAEECRVAIEQLIIGFEGHSLRVTISIGLAKYESCNNISVDSIIAQADAALYSAKANGRNCFVVYNKNPD